MLGCLGLPLKPAALVTFVTLRTPGVGVFLIRLGGPMEPDWLAGNEALGDVLADEGLGLRTMLLALDHMFLAHRAAQRLSSAARVAPRLQRKVRPQDVGALENMHPRRRTSERVKPIARPLTPWGHARLG